MDDDITNAINSLETDAAGAATPATSATPVPDSSNMPPIFRPEDINTITESVVAPPVATADTSVPFSGEPVPVVQPAAEEPPTEIVIPEKVAPVEAVPVPESAAPLEPAQPIISEAIEPQATQQVYAPMPQMVAEQPLQPIAPTTPNPAMVPDPLFDAQTNQPPQSVAVDGSMIPIPSDTKLPEPQKLNIPASTKKIILYVVLGILAVALIIGGYFGFMAYQTSANLKLLQTAVGNLASLPVMSSNIAVTSGETKLAAKVEVDDSKNVRFTSTSSGVPASVIYLKPKDLLYVLDSDQSTSVTKKYDSYTAASKVADVLSAESVQLLEPVVASKVISADDIQDFKSLGSETVGATKAAKFSFTPDSGLQSEIMSALIGDTGEASYNLSTTKLAFTLWIDKSSQQIVKVDIATTGSIKGNGDAAARKLTLPGLSDDGTSFNLDWQEDFSYNYTDIIKLPIGAKIVSTTDASKAFDAYFGAGAAGKAQDKELESTANSLKDAIIAYQKDNGAYPAATDASELLAALTSGDNPYLTSDFDVSNINYTFDATTSKYVISFRLNYQDQTGTNISGSAPNKVYSVTN